MINSGFTLLNTVLLLLLVAAAIYLFVSYRTKADDLIRKAEETIATVSTATAKAETTFANVNQATVKAETTFANVNQATASIKNMECSICNSTVSFVQDIFKDFCSTSKCPPPPKPPSVPSIDLRQPTSVNLRPTSSGAVRLVAPPSSSVWDFR